MSRTSSSSQFNKFSTPSSSWKNDFKNKNRDDRRKPSKQNSSKISVSTKCYRCQSYWHVAANCGNEIEITFIDGDPIKTLDSDSKSFAYHPNLEKSDDSEYNQEGFDDECNCIRPALLNYISFIRYAFSQYEEKDDWRRTSIFHTFTKIGERIEKW